MTRSLTVSLEKPHSILSFCFNFYTSNKIVYKKIYSQNVIFSKIWYSEQIENISIVLKTATK